MVGFELPHIWDKINNIAKDCDQALSNAQNCWVPLEPMRDLKVLHPKDHPPKKGFSTIEGQARMLHDLASIELQAMELCLRSLIEYPEAPEAFREELRTLTISESQHLSMCIEGIEALGFKWGDWPVHLALWKSVSSEDPLLDRILIVHRYLEASGLDAGHTLIKRLEGTSGKTTIQSIVKQINFDEIGHVEFGSRWYRQICSSEKIDPNDDFTLRMDSLRQRLPKRVEPLNYELRLKAGFSIEEIEYCENLRLDFLKPNLVKET
jgi:uncharacterized ferritin-like protein (DUF455 family)